jgi:hypothetical protein
METQMADGKRTPPDDVGRQIDQAEPDEALKRAVAKDLDAHLPQDEAQDLATQEPLRTSQREEQVDKAPGS